MPETRHRNAIMGVPLILGSDHLKDIPGQEDRACDVCLTPVRIAPSSLERMASEPEADWSVVCPRCARDGGRPSQLENYSPDLQPLWEQYGPDSTVLSLASLQESYEVTYGSGTAVEFTKDGTKAKATFGYEVDDDGRVRLGWTQDPIIVASVQGAYNRGGKAAVDELLQQVTEDGLRATTAAIAIDEGRDDHGLILLDETLLDELAAEERDDDRAVMVAEAVREGRALYAVDHPEWADLAKGQEVELLPDDYELDPWLDLGFDPDDPNMRISRRPYLEALKQQFDLMHALHTPKMRLNTGILIAAFARQGRMSMSPGMARAAQAQPERIGAAYCNQIADIVNRAATYYVAPSMCDLLDHSAEQLPEFEARIHDIPDRRGWVYFGRPMMWRDWDGNEVSIRAMTWEVLPATRFKDNTPRVHLHWFSHRDDRDYWTDQMEERYGSDALDTMPRWILDTVTMWPIGKDWTEVGQDARNALALWLLLKQPIGYPAGVKPPRALRRESERTLGRSGVDETAIMVCYLRKRIPKRGEQDPDYEFSEETRERYRRFRAPVSGHWRQQWYPSEARHRPKWIAPYLKGPEDAPVVIRDKVSVWKR